MGGAARTLLSLLATAALSLALASTASARPGDLDPSYGDRGLATWPGGLYPTLDEGGSLLTLGRAAGEGFGGSTTVRRTTAAGAPDPTFGEGGVAAVGETFWQGAGLAVQPDGRILVLLTQTDTGSCPCRFLLYRLLPDGQIDPTLDGVEVAIESKYNSGDLQVDPSGRILVPGDGGVLGLTPEGEVDPAFGEDGVVTVNGSVDELERDPTGGYLIGWVRQHEPDRGINIAKIDSDGTTDADWGTDGTVNLGGPPPDMDEAFALAPSASGRVAIGATETGYVGPVPPAPWLFVLDSEGDVDADFDTEPALTLPVPPQGVGIGGLAWDEAGRLLMAGGSAFSNPYAPWSCTSFIARFQADGSPDQGFAEGGLGLFPERFSNFPTCSLGSIALQSDGQILAHFPPAHFPDGAIRSAAARFLAAPGGPDDADADGVLDGDDACPRRSAEHADGCQRAHVPIEFERRNRGFRGRVDAPRACLTNPNEMNSKDGFRTIFLYRERDGEDELVGRSQLSGKRFSFGRKPRGHAYYAQLPAMLQPGVVVCPEVRSPAVGLLKLELGAAKRHKPARRLRARARCDGLDCKLAARAVVKLRRPGKKNLKLRSRRVRTNLEAGERERLTFKLKRRDAKRLRRSIRNSDQTRKRSRVVFKAKARGEGQRDQARERAKLRRR
jgi:uncharacterized delta-60 repeat protein